MEAELNVSLISLDGFIQVHRFGFVYFSFMFIVYLLILSSNLTIVFLVAFQRSLHQPMFVFIAALLLNSVVFSSVVYPKLLVDFLSERQMISLPACFLQNFLYYSLGASEFLLLSVMSYDRYVSICKPLRYASIMSRSRVLLLLLSAWTLPALHFCLFHLSVLQLHRKLCSFSLRGIFCNGPLFHLLCARSNVLLVLTALLITDMAVLPVLFILYTYSRILLVLRTCKEARSKAAQTCLPHLLVLVSFSCFGLFNVIVFSLETNFSKTVSFILTVQIVVQQPLCNPLIYGLKVKEIHRRLLSLLRKIKTN